MAVRREERLCRSFFSPGGLLLWGMRTNLKEHEHSASSVVFLGNASTRCFAEKDFVSG